MVTFIAPNVFISALGNSPTTFLSTKFKLAARPWPDARGAGAAVRRAGRAAVGEGHAGVAHRERAAHAPRVLAWPHCVLASQLVLVVLVGLVGVHDGRRRDVLRGLRGGHGGELPGLAHLPARLRAHLGLQRRRVSAIYENFAS